MVNQPTIIKSFSFAMEGIYHALRDNMNMRIHFVIAFLILVVSYIFQISHIDFIILLIMILFVISAEMINTSLEEMVDLITTEHRQQAKVAKDVAAGMVLVASVGAAVIGAIILLPYLLTSI